MFANFTSLLFGLVYLVCMVQSRYVSTDSIAPETWLVFNKTLGGRLRQSEPLAAPCFSVVNGHHTNPNPDVCAKIQAGYSDPNFLSEHFGAYMFHQWSSCQRMSQQCLLDDSAPSNPVAWKNFSCAQGSVPSYYIQVTSPMDVSKAFTFARATGVQLTIKNSGHDYKGRSSMRGSLSLWTHKLQNISYSSHFVPIGSGTNESHPAMTLAAGISWENAYSFAETYNVTIIGGYHRTIGASGGWVMGGGHSVLSPVFGLGIDRVLQFRAVTPDGVYRVVNTYTNPDLFWALRGGGGSTFGVILETTFLVEPKMKLQVASVSYNTTDSNVLPFIRLIVDNARKWGNEGWGGRISTSGFINVNPLLSLSEAQESIRPISEFIQSQNGTVVVEELPSWYAFFQKYVGKAGVGIEALLGTRLIPSANFDTNAGRDQVYDALTKLLPFRRFSMLLTTPFLYNYTEGTTSATPAWRKALWHIC